MQARRSPAPETTLDALVTAGASALPQRRLVRAAVSGLLALGAAGCPSDDEDTTDADAGTDDHSHELSDAELETACEDMVTEAVQAEQMMCEEPDLDALCADMVEAAQCPASELDTLCEDIVTDAVAEAVRPLTPEDKTTGSEQQEQTFAALTAECDDRGGYVQIHASCGSVNTCRGFSYGDWGPDGATLTEHSCSGVNGCNGLSCVVLPEDGGKTGAEVYEAEYASPGPGACVNCHTPWGDDGPDVTKFKVWVLPGSTRTVDNWLDRPVAAQERIVAFGAHGVTDDGIAYQNMAAYKDVLSRAEIERVVAHVRTLDAEVHVAKLVDP